MTEIVLSSFEEKSYTNKNAQVWRNEINTYTEALINQYNKIYARRVDLRYPVNLTAAEISVSNRDINRFIHQFNRTVDDKEKCIGYVVVREFGRIKNKKHFHAVLLFESDNVIGRCEDNIDEVIQDCWESISGGRGAWFGEKAIITTERLLPVHWVNYLVKTEGKRRDGFRTLLKGRVKSQQKVENKREKTRFELYCSEMYSRAIRKKSKAVVIAGTMHLPRGVNRMITKEEMKGFFREVNKRLYEAGRGYLTAGVAALQHTAEKCLASFTVFLDGHKNGWCRVKDIIDHKVHDILLQSWWTMTGKGTMLVEDVHFVQGRSKDHVSKNRANKKSVLGKVFESGKKTLSVLSQFFRSEKKKTNPTPKC